MEGLGELPTKQLVAFSIKAQGLAQPSQGVDPPQRWPGCRYQQPVVAPGVHPGQRAGAVRAGAVGQQPFLAQPNIDGLLRIKAGHESSPLLS